MLKLRTVKTPKQYKKECPGCGRLWEGGTCPHCGYFN